MLQISLIFLIFIVLVIPTGRYLYRVAEGEKTFVDPVLNKIDNVFYRVCKIDKVEMGWKRYALSLLLTNGILMIIGYVILLIQSIPLFNPNGISNMSPVLAFNTVISFITNTNLQHYAGESSLSYFSQMAVITMMMFASAASGFAVCMAFIRGICGKKSMGNFFVDVIRVTTRFLIPVSMIVGLLLVSQGSPQTFDATKTVTTVEGTWQDIPMGPIASLVSIKHLGTNGGGFLGANSATPFENPTVFTNIIEVLSMMILPGACVVIFGLMFYYKKKLQTQELSNKAKIRQPVFMGAEGRTIFIAMSILFLIGVLACSVSENAGNPILAKFGLNQSMGNMEGKEVRFGIAQSSLFTAVTTSFTTGAVNNMHDTLTPLGGMIPMLNMMLNVVFGGIGIGFMNMILYVILSVFLCGLMIGRTPEYLGKKVEGHEMKLTVLCILLHPLLILGFSALAVSTSAGLSGITNPGFHGFSQVLYEYASAAANNGSGFEGLADNTVFWNITTGIVMFAGRYIPIVLQLAIASSLMKKRFVNETTGTLRTDTAPFGILLAFIVLVFSALTFFPVVSLGPIAEHLTLGR